MSETRHTPTPWRYFIERDRSGIGIGPPYSETYFTEGEVRSVVRFGNLERNGVRQYHLDDAEFIVRAVNSHEQLLAACKKGELYR